MQNGRAQHQVTWWIIALLALTDAVWIARSDFRVATAGAVWQIVGLLVLVAIIRYYRSRQTEEKIVTTLVGVLQLILFTAFAAPFSYLCASLGGPLWDSKLHGWDRALGLDWLSYLAWVNDHPLIGLIYSIAYASLMAQMAVVCVALGFTGRAQHLRIFMFATVLSGVLCILISAAMPALAMYAHLGLRPENFPNLNPQAAYVHILDIQGLRNGTLRDLNLATMQGIITFPSYHAALGLILSFALWSLPILRWPGVALNLLLIAATPIDGGHYFVDLGAGLALAALSLAAARSLERAETRDPAAAPSRPGTQLPAA